ncbi:mCG1038759, partial [Mus musculus]
GLLETVLRVNNYQVFLVTLVTLYFLVTLNWYLWYFFQQRPPHFLELWFLPLNTPLSS